MATKEVRELRSAYTHYMHYVQELAKASKHGERPPDQVLATEDRAFNDLALASETLLAALRACHRWG
jgi:hypothetical protein